MRTAFFITLILTVSNASAASECKFIDSLNIAFATCPENPDALCYLNQGIAYEKGLETKSNLDMAITCYTDSANLGSAEAQHQLGLIYLHGDDEVADHTQAERWIRRSAEQNYTQAMLSLGYILYQGLGVPRDLEQAMAWYGRAYAAGDLQGRDYQIAVYDQILREDPARPLTQDVNPFLDAVIRNDIDRIQAYLAYDVDIEGNVNSSGLNAMMLAAVFSNFEIADLLIEHGANPNARAEGGMTGLHAAVNRDNPEAVKWLIEMGTDPSLETGEGFTPLLLAVQLEALASIEALLESGDDPNNPGSVGFPPIVAAAAEQKNMVAWALIKGGADVNSTTQEKLTALHYAAANGNVELGRMLMNNCANKELKSSDGRTARSLAATSGYFDFIEVLRTSCQ